MRLVVERRARDGKIGCVGKRIIIIAAALACAASACGSDEGTGGGSVGSGPSDGSFAQGHVYGGPQKAGNDGKLDIIVSPTSTYPRCEDPASVALGDPEFDYYLFEVPASAGDYEVSFVAAGPTAAPSGKASVTISAVDELHVAGTFSPEGEGPSGPFDIDTCGRLGQSALTLETCAVPSLDLATAYAVSPSGRLAVSTFDLETTVYQRSASAGECSYVVDTTYGDGGVIPLAGAVRGLAFDGNDVLYMATDAEAVLVDMPGSLVVVAPGAPLRSCLYEPMLTASTFDSAPSQLVVTRDGALAYASFAGWEKKFDLASPTLTEGGGGVCAFELSNDVAVRFADALTVHDDGFLFLRQPDSFEGPVHAEVTDPDLVTTLRFGGTSDNLGIESLLDCRAGSRCALGYCMADERGMSIWSDVGAFLRYVEWSTSLPELGPVTPSTAIEGTADDAFLLVTSDGGATVLRITGAP